MKNSRKLHYSLIILLLLPGVNTLLGQSAEIPSAAPKEQVAAGFANPQLSLAQEQAFEQRAQQIIREFLDYYNLLRDATLDPELRDALYTELTQLLYHPDIQLKLHSEADKTTINVINFSTSPEIKPREITLLQTDTTSGKPVWHYQVQLAIDQQIELVEVELLVFRKFKTFGSQVKEVWEVALLGWE